MIFVTAPTGICYGELGNPLTSLPAAVNVKPEVPTPLLKEAHLTGTEPLYLAVYLNSRMLTEVIEAQEKDGSIYLKMDEISRLVEAPITENRHALATLQALETMFPAKFTYSEKKQVLFIKGQGDLPVEKRWKREQLHAFIPGNQITEDTPIVDFEYGLLGPPSFDFSASYFKNGDERYNYSFKGASEALFGTANIFGRGLDNERLTDLRVSWERFHPDWFVRVGDVVAPPIELVAQAEAGRGINFSTFPMQNASQFDTETLTGDLLDGWEVELYRGNTLLDFRTSNGTGRYMFQDIPLLFGENDIVLKFYGPQGQVRTETRPVNIGQSMAPPGEMWFRFSAIDQGENIFLGRNSQTRFHVSGFRGFGEVYYGVSSELTLTASLISYSSVLQEQRTLAKTGYIASLLGGSMKMDFLADDAGGSGVQYSFLRRIMGWGVQYQHVEFFDLKTDREPNLKRRHNIKFNRGFGPVFVEASAQRWIDTFDVTRHEFKGKVSGYIHQVTLTHDLQANYGGGTEFIRGNLIATGRINPNLLLRAHLNYDVKPEMEIRNIRGRLDYKPNREVTLRMDVIKNMTDDENFTVSQSILWEGKKAGVGITGSYSSNGDYMLNASVSFSLSPNTQGAYHMHRNPGTSLGTVNVRVFLDHDQDGVYNSETDELIENVKLENQSDVSDESGMVALKAPAYRLTRIKIDDKSLPDPFMVTPPPVAVRPRPSHINTMNIPVWETGEIEGVAEPGEVIELMADGKVIDTTQAEFDGFFLFEKVRFRDYQVHRHLDIQKIQVNRTHPIVRVKWDNRVTLTSN